MGGLGWFWVVVGCCGWLRLVAMVLAGVVVAGFGWLWVIVGRCGWFWLFPRFSMYGGLTTYWL